MFNRINGEVLNLANPEHVKIAKYLKNQSIMLKKDAVLKNTCNSFHMGKDYVKYKDEVAEIKATTLEYNKKEAKHKIELLRDELIIKCCVKIKEQIELGNLKADTEVQDYYYIDKDKMKTKKL